MKAQQWANEADVYKNLLATETSDVHFGVGIPGNNILKLIKPADTSQRALDIGCGSGENLAALSSLGYSVVGADLSERQLVLAEELMKNMESSTPPQFFNIPAERIEEVDGVFDVIISVGVLHFCHDLSSVIHNIASKLTQKGSLVLSLPHPIDMISDYKELASDVEINLSSYFPSGQIIHGSRYWSKFGGSESSGYVFSEYVYTISDIINMLIREGLKIESFIEPVCDHKEEYPCRFKFASKHFTKYYSPRMPQYAIYVARKDS